MKTIIIIFVSLIILCSSGFGQYLTDNKQEHDSLAMLVKDGIKKNIPVTAKFLEDAFAVFGDNLIKLNDQRYVNMPKVSPNGLMAKVLTEVNQLNSRMTDAEELLTTKDQERQKKLVESMIFRLNKRNKVELITPPHKK